MPHHPIDLHVGTRIKLRRNLLGWSQERLGETLGLTFQQVQKYEKGTNRVSASKLYQLGRVLDVPISFFFDDLPSEYDMPRPKHMNKDDDTLLYYSHSTALLRAFQAIATPEVRGSILSLVQAVAKEKHAAAASDEDDMATLDHDDDHDDDMDRDRDREVEMRVFL